ncbi:cytochrome P450 [Chiua virens]|nr:cytochrome P450 [Chiua virens]
MVPIVQGALVPGAYQVDHYPILQYVPFYGRQLRKYGEDEYQMFTGYMARYRSQMFSENGPCSVAKEIVTQPVKDGNLGETEKAYFLGSLVGAAFDTTQVAISVIMMAAARFPETQEVVYTQLDAVVGRDAPPTFADWTALTELQAFILEALRWRPVNPFGAPRRASKDVFWNGYCIPAGATVFGNHWSIARDPEVFPDPERFNPQRWIGPDGNIKSEMKAYSFGFGRRTCVGSNLAIRSLYIAAASIFWSFKIAEDSKRPIDDTAFVPGIVSHPKPFSLLFEPRMDVAQLREVMGHSSGIKAN